VATPVETIEPLTDVVSLPWTVNERGALAGIKTVSYAANVRALLHAHEHGAHDGVFTDGQGRLCEATTANVFVVHDRRVRTPTLDTGCLPGVTRALALEACARMHVRAEEATLSLDDLRGADEAFLTSSVAVVRCIRRVDGIALRDAPGPITTAVAQALATLMDEQPDP
jgi:branched-chain amino acid aminotransferase